MALTDRRTRPLSDLRISVTDRCNMRCPYCMPRDVFGSDYPFLPRKEILVFEEVVAVSRALVERGVGKVRLTGGEPLLRQDVDVLVELLAGLDGVHDLALTTNGILLPKMAAKLKGAGLKRVTVSLDSLDQGTFARMTDSPYKVERVLEGIAAAEEAGLGVKINTVVRKGMNEAGILDLARHFRGTGHPLRFIEFMDVGNSNGWSLDQVVPGKTILDTVHAAFPLEAVPPRHPGEVAKRFRYVDGEGEVGVITSVSQPFCGACSRLRLSTDGRLYTCLFASQGHDLRPVLRGEAPQDLGAFIDNVWRARADNYSERRTANTEGLPKVEMSYIGG